MPSSLPNSLLNSLENILKNILNLAEWLSGRTARTSECAEERRPKKAEGNERQC